MKAETIVQKLKNGDIQALRLVYELFYRSTLQAAFFVTKDAGLAEDAAHEVFLKLQSKIGQLEDPSKLETWLCRMATNNARDVLRHRSKSKLFAEARGIYIQSQSISPETVMLDNEEKKLIQGVIGHLQLEYKHVIYLKYYRKMSIEDISKILGIPDGTVKSRLNRARIKIKKILERESPTKRHKSNKLKDTEEV